LEGRDVLCDSACRVFWQHYANGHGWLQSQRPVLQHIGRVSSRGKRIPTCGDPRERPHLGDPCHVTAYVRIPRKYNSNGVRNWVRDTAYFSFQQMSTRMSTRCDNQPVHVPFARYQICASGWFIAFFRDFQWQLSPTNRDDVDFQGILTHEFGHQQLAVAWDNGHLYGADTRRCSMNDGTSRAQSSQRRFLCVDDIEKSKLRRGLHSNSIMQTSIPPGPDLTPPVSGWQTPVAHTGTSGVGFGFAVRGPLGSSASSSIVQSFFQRKGGMLSHCDWTVSSCSVGLAAPQVAPHRRTTVVAAGDGTWFAISTQDGPDPQGIQQWHSDGVWIHKSVDRINWQFVSRLKVPSDQLDVNGDPIPFYVDTKLPIAAAFNPGANRVVLALVAYTLEEPFSGTCPFGGCSGEVVFYDFPVSAPTSIRGPMRMPGRPVATAGPGLACTHEPFGAKNCVVMFASARPDRSLSEYRIYFQEPPPGWYPGSPLQYVPMHSTLEVSHPGISTSDPVALSVALDNYTVGAVIRPLTGGNDTVLLASKRGAESNGPTGGRRLIQPVGRWLLGPPFRSWRLHELRIIGNCSMRIKSNSILRVPRVLVAGLSGVCLASLVALAKATDEEGERKPNVRVLSAADRPESRTLGASHSMRVLVGLCRFVTESDHIIEVRLGAAGAVMELPERSDHLAEAVTPVPVTIRHIAKSSRDLVGEISVLFPGLINDGVSEMGPVWDSRSGSYSAKLFLVDSDESHHIHAAGGYFWYDQHAGVYRNNYLYRAGVSGEEFDAVIRAVVAGRPCPPGFGDPE
jgi:hypothetical protein